MLCLRDSFRCVSFIAKIIIFLPPMAKGVSESYDSKTRWNCQNLQKILILYISFYRKQSFCWLLSNTFVLLAILVLFTEITQGHVCLLRERVSLTGEPQWSLSLQERCYCQTVVAPTFISIYNCSLNEMSSKWLWYTSDPVPLTKQENWTPERLDKLLERIGYCGKNFKIHLNLLKPCYRLSVMATSFFSKVNAFEIRPNKSIL